jgi:hypothetical protein
VEVSEPNGEEETCRFDNDMDSGRPMVPRESGLGLAFDDAWRRKMKGGTM